MQKYKYLLADEYNKILVEEYLRSRTSTVPENADATQSTWRVGVTPVANSDKAHPLEAKAAALINPE